MTKRLALLVGAAMLLTACSNAEDERVTAKQIAETCGKDTSQLTLSSDEKAVEYNFRPGSESTEAIYNCLLKETGAPSEVDYRVQETRPVDGTQTEEWDGWKFLWSYDGKSSRMHLSEA